MSVRMWTVTVPAGYPYDKLVAGAGLQSPKRIVKDNTPLGTGVGVEDGTGSAGMLAFCATPDEQGEYIAYYWRKA